MAAKIIVFDIETAPGLGWAWEQYDTNIIKFKQPWFMLSFAWKYLGDDVIQTRSLPDYKGYSKNKTNDKHLVTDLWNIFNEADILVAHNGDAFDIKKSNARFAKHDLPPYSPIKSIDTYKIAKKHFKFDSVSLASLAQFLEIGEKIPNLGFKTWEGCIEGDEASWELMKRYNARDVEIGEKVYYKLRPWASAHPNIALYTDHDGCPNCGGTHIQRRGIEHLKTRSYQRLKCQDCGRWFPGKSVKRNEIN